ncbi:hypothetical protein QBC33DRAFT_559336 [Phialemonium atrogriseum]|uniref:SnoaL-like domain-containing protein n=1 Tax=Phialemonium atrogriseum TaxID=1093897 RepID=A0AAJ0C3Z0_9PEZI|nr:uncharacterized protein QBC33DRAFT_559336 [Phialemonium atrogriseum]KAK1767211.1 hypothetical protein QBC33DRAFT_559336 [Phialemonium atrogriseum]
MYPTSLHAVPIPSTRLDTVNQLLTGYSSLSVTQLTSTLSPTFQYRVLPTSLGMPPLDRASFARHAASVFAAFDEFRLVPDQDSLLEDAERSSVAVYARMEGVLRGGGGGTTTTPWASECVMLIRLSVDGTEVVGVDEFVDSAKAREMQLGNAPGEFGIGAR